MNLTKKQRAVVYIRVSTDEQADKGNSLPYQESRIKHYCDLQQITIDSVYKEDYSAKTFDRPEFKKLLAYCQRNRQLIDLVLVLKWDRFSRNASESYQMLNRFYKLNIQVQAVEQPLDLSVPENKLMLAFYLTAPEVENDRRSINTVMGMRQKLLKGEWIGGKFPLGYKRDKNTAVVYLTPEADLIRKAFEMVIHGRAITEIASKMRLLGINRSSKVWGKMLRNPLYKAEIVHKLLDKPVKATHPPIVSESVFAQAQAVLNGGNVTRIAGTNTFPLKGFCGCDQCQKPLTGYEVKKKQRASGSYLTKKTAIPYYKCNTKGCSVNIAQSKLHESFTELLDLFIVDPRLVPIIKDRLQLVYKTSISEYLQENTTIKKNLATVNQRIDKLNMAMLDGNVSADEYAQIKEKLMKDRQQLEQSLKPQDNLSNPKEFMNFGLKLVSKTTELWQKLPFNEQVRLQKLIFPEGLYYSKENNVYRTPFVNSFFALISAFTANRAIKNRYLQIENIGKITFGSP